MSAVLEAMYAPEEIVLLDTWLAGRGGSLPPDVAALLDRIGYGFEPGDLYTRLDAWVGAFATRDVQGRLPNWGVAYADGSVETTRTIDQRRRSRRVASCNRLLFEINWADSGPGMSWPAQYRLGWLPGFDRHVVTCSADTAEVLGYCDFALGSFPHVSDVAGRRARARAIIVADWRIQYERYDQGPWAYLFQAGEVGEDEAMQWRAEAWGSGEEEEGEEGEQGQEGQERQER